LSSDVYRPQLSPALFTHPVRFLHTTQVALCTVQRAEVKL